MFRILFFCFSPEGLYLKTASEACSAGINDPEKSCWNESNPLRQSMCPLSPRKMGKLKPGRIQLWGEKLYFNEIYLLLMSLLNTVAVTFKSDTLFWYWLKLYYWFPWLSLLTFGNHQAACVLILNINYPYDTRRRWTTHVITRKLSWDKHKG